MYYVKVGCNGVCCTLHIYFSMMRLAFGFEDARYQKRVLIPGCASTLILTYYLGLDDCFVVFKIVNFNIF